MHTFADPLQRAMQIAPDKVGVIDATKQFTFAELGERCARLVGALRDLGMNPWIVLRSWQTTAMPTWKPTSACRQGAWWWCR